MNGKVFIPFMEFNMGEEVDYAVVRGEGGPFVLHQCFLDFLNANGADLEKIGEGRGHTLGGRSIITQERRVFPGNRWEYPEIEIELGLCVKGSGVNKITAFPKGVITTVAECYDRPVGGQDPEIARKELKTSIDLPQVTVPVEGIVYPPKTVTEMANRLGFCAFLSHLRGGRLKNDGRIDMAGEAAFSPDYVPKLSDNFHRLLERDFFNLSKDVERLLKGSESDVYQRYLSCNTQLAQVRRWIPSGEMTWDPKCWYSTWEHLKTTEVSPPLLAEFIQSLRETLWDYKACPNDTHLICGTRDLEDYLKYRPCAFPLAVYGLPNDVERELRKIAKVSGPILNPTGIPYFEVTKK